MPRLGAKRIVSLLVVVAAIAVGTVWWSKRESPYDRSFDTRVTDPAQGANRPVVLFDEGHRNPHTTHGAYKPLADLWRSDGCTVQVLKEPLSAATLHGVSVLVLALAMGANDTNDDPAYATEEAVAVEAWVRAGGALLLVTDHWPYGSAAATMARRFDVTMGTGLVQDPTHHDAARGDSHLVFSTDNGLLRDHPIVRGRSPEERVQRVLTFTGQSVQGPAEAVPFLVLSDDATELTPGPARAERSGGDVRVNMEYGAPVTAAGRAQGLALELDAGRVVVLGEAGMLRAQRGSDGQHVGMNVPGYDNRQLALNIVRWLSRAL